MLRKPAMTSLLNGQAVKVRFGSISVTCILLSIRLSARAQLAPPKPPPMTTTRAPDCARVGHGKVKAAAEAAMPATTFLRVIRRNASMSGCSVSGGDSGRRPSLGEGYVLIPKRHRADAFSCCGEIGVENGRCSHADRWLPDAAPETAARHHDRFDLRHLVDPHRIVGVEIGLLDPAILHGAAAVEQAGQAVHEGTGNLTVDLRGIDGMAGI